MNKFNHAYTVAFEFISEKEKPGIEDAKDIIRAMKSRIELLEQHPEQLIEAIDLYDTCKAD